MSTRLLATVSKCVVGMAAAFALQAHAGSSWDLKADTPIATADGNLTSIVGYAVNGGNFFQSGITEYGGGLGMSSDGGGEPNHALDNNGNTEALLLTFSTNVVLESVTIGYKNTDSDISVLRYVGDGTPTLAEAQAALTSSTKSTLTTKGWELVGSYANLQENVAKTTGATSSQSSSWWLISAYNSSYGTTSVSSTSNLGNGNDYVKVLAVAGSKSNKTPEPNSIALLGLALLGAVAARRRQSAGQA